MKVCFIGVGSIATRHIRNLKELFGQNVWIDILRSGRGMNIPEDVIDSVSDVYYRFEELPTDYDVIFITNPTRLHYDTLMKCSRNARSFFIEKPVFETGEEDLNVIEAVKGKVCYVACPLRYTNTIQYLKKHIDLMDIYSVRCISSSYLPDWRPEKDYRSTYSAKKELGGGVSIDLIHEWDYLSFLFGEPKRVSSFIGKKSHLEIDSDDIAIYMAEYEDKFVELHLDYFGRVATRKIELYCKDDIIEADLIEQKIVYKKENRVLNLEEERNSYQKKELLHFFDILNDSSLNDNTIEQACQTLKLTKGNI